MTARKIAIITLENKDCVVLKAAIETASGFETGVWECSDDPSKAQVIILDPGSKQGKAIIEEYAGRDDAPLLVGYSRDLVPGQQVLRFMIEPPLNYNNVLNTLRQIDLLVKAPEEEAAIDNQNRKEQNKPKVLSKRTGSTKESVHDTTREIPEISEVVSIVESEGDDKKRLHHAIKQIFAENKSVEISHPRFPSIKICSEKHWFIFPEDLDKQTELFRTPLSEFTIEEKGDEIRRQAFSGAFPKALWELIYTATLLGTGGELLEPLLPEDRLHLIELPEFSLAPHSEQHIAIADYMISHSATAGNIANNLDIDLATVVDFCNACQSIGLLIVSGTPQNRLFRLINRIIEQNRSVEITHPDFPPIDICTQKDWFIFNGNLNEYTEMFQVDVGEFSFEDRGDNIRKQAFSGSFPKSLWELVYTATMFGTEGKMLPPLLPTDRLSLKKKPQFEYVLHTEEHIKLADYMQVYSDTVHDIAVHTGVSLTTVIDFCNMCQSINLIERNASRLSAFSEKEAETTQEIKPQKVESKASKLINSLLSNLRQ